MPSLLLDKCTFDCLPRAMLLLLIVVIAQQFNNPAIAASGDYCEPSLCEFYNGSHVLQETNTACGNNGSFGEDCGASPKLLYMTTRRRQLLLDMHNLVRDKVAEGGVEGYAPASQMPMLKWDKELEHMAELHAKRCRFAHDKCRNTPRFKFSGQNIGYFWIGRDFKSHSRRMKTFVLDWFKEYKDANQSYIDSYHSHPEGKKIGHFTMLVGDQVRRVGCAGVKFLEPEDNKFLFMLTCNYDYNNIYNEPIYETGPMASKCADPVSKKFPALCDWKVPEEKIKDDDNMLDNNIAI
ncbi:hypothetical protein KR044_008411 [Drosophila immigrans]|nr:hypothetical protein KR044_008411 [Drosophila immigrans]